MKPVTTKVTVRGAHEIHCEINSLFNRAEIVKNLQPEKADALEFIAKAAREKLNA